MKKILKLLFILTFLILPVYGNSQSLGNFKEIALNRSAVGKTIQLPTDSMIVLKLPSIPSSGYCWEVINHSQLQGILRELHGSPYGMMSSEYAEPDQDEQILPGSTIIQLIRLVGEKAGNATVTLALKRPWEANHIKLLRFTIQSLGKFTGSFSHSQYIKTHAAETPDQIYVPGLPAHWDWREQNGVTPVCNQLSCGSCWAFATTAVMEAKILIKDGVSRNLSEQYLMDCNESNFGCRGGSWVHDYHWFKTIPGISAAGCRYESEYLYMTSDERCMDKPAHEQLEGWAFCDDVPGANIIHDVTTAQLKQKIYDYGPVGTYICSDTMQSYTGGVHTLDCSNPGHMVVITGWDDIEGCFYIKNSWGSDWGENGYIRMAYNTCMVGRNATYALYEKTNPRIIYRSLVFHEDKVNDGSIGNSIELRIEDSTSDTQFSRSYGYFIQGSEYTVSKLPANLTLHILALSNTSAKVFINNTANNHEKVNNISNLTISFLGSAFTGNNSTGIENSTFSNLEIQYMDPYQIVYHEEKAPFEYVGPSYLVSKTYGAENGSLPFFFTLFWYDKADEPDPNNNQCLKLETTLKYPLLTHGSTAPSNIKSLSYGTEIGPNSEFWTDNGFSGTQHTLAGPAYHDLKGGQHYLGIRFMNNGYPVYGWIQVEINAEGTACRLVNFAWQQDPNKTILAGQAIDTGGTFITPDFSATPTTITEGETIFFSDTSIGNPTSWSWSFPGGTPSTSNYNGPTITYNTPGTYDVTLTVANLMESKTLTRQLYITVNPKITTTYCTSNGNSNTYEWISRVQVETLDNANTANPGGYADYTSQPTSISPGSFVNVTLAPGFSSSTYTEYWNIWIDYNKNGSFDDAGENVFSGSGLSAVTGTFAVPSDVSGNTRMRVSMHYNSAPPSCGSLDYGEVEDYKVIFGSTTSPPEANFFANITTVNEGDTIQFRDTSTGKPSSWSWDFPGGTPENSTVQHPSVIYKIAGTYGVTLSVSNAYGNNSIRKSGYINVNQVGVPPIALFSASPTILVEGNSVQFTDSSTENPTSWSWSFPGGTPSSSSAQNPLIIYNTAGTYSVTLTASNSHGSDFMTKTAYITINPPISYCASYGNVNTSEWIDQIQIHTFCFSTGQSSNGYEDHTPQTIQLSPGLNTGVYLTPGYNSSSYTEYWMIWIDYNKNGNFDDAEENVFSGSGTSTVSGSFIVPSNANGSNRMRISMKYYSTPTSCESFDYGEVEDYTVNF